MGFNVWLMGALFPGEFMKVKKIKRGKLAFFVRENTMDEWVVDEVLGKSEYLKPLDLKKGDQVLEIGANIGAFSVLAMSRGCHVRSFEPEPGNYALASRNIGQNSGGCCILSMEGVSNMEKEILLYLNEKKNRGNHTTAYVRGRRFIEIKCLGINDILAEHRFTKAKIDCEGEEYNIIMAVKSWGKIERIRMEWHRRILKDERNILFHNLWEKLERDGFRIIGKRDGRKWHQMITAIKK